MCRLYADKGERDQKYVEISAKFLLTREQMEIVDREVRKHREWQRKHGYDVTGGEYTEKDLIRYAVNRYIGELRKEEQEKMRRTEEMREELHMMPEQFRELYRLGLWSAAAQTYEHAVTISGFLEMEQEERDRLLGEFDPVQVEDAYRKAGWTEDETRDAV